MKDIVSFLAFNQNSIFFLCLCRKHGMDQETNQVVEIQPLSVLSEDEMLSYLIIITQLCWLLWSLRFPIPCLLRPLVQTVVPSSPSSASLQSPSVSSDFRHPIWAGQ